MQKKIICLVIALFIITAALSSCSDKNKKGTQGSTASVTEPPAITDINGNVVKDISKIDANGFLKDDLPDDIDYGGKKITILAWDGQTYEEFYTERSTGEAINDALYKRNSRVEDRLGVTLEIIKTKGGASDFDSYSMQVRADVMSGDTYEFDLLAAYSRVIALCAYSGLTQNLNNSDYLDLEKPWWPDTLQKQTTINDKLYFCSGDLSISLFHNLPVIYFNKDIAANHGISSDTLYQLVIDGDWTLNKMMELSEGIYSDVNGDSKKGIEDQYGYMGTTTQIQPLFWGCGITAIDVEDGLMKVSESYTGAKMQGLFENILGWMYNTDNAFYTSSAGQGNTAFSEGRCLFFQNVASYTMTKFNEIIGLKYGILPCPKADNIQSDYRSIMGNTVTLYAVPANGTDMSICSAVLECMGSEGYRLLSPAIYESAMKVRYAPDESTAQMYDIIRESALFDNGRIFSTVIDDLFTKTINVHLQSNNPNWMSAMKSIIEGLDIKVSEINDKFATLN